MLVLLRAEDAAHTPCHAAGFLGGMRACKVLNLASHSGDRGNSRCRGKGLLCQLVIGRHACAEQMR